MLRVFIARVEKKEQYAALNKLSTKMPEESTLTQRTTQFMMSLAA